MVTSETPLPDDPRRSGLLHEVIVVAGFELGSVVASERPSSLFSSVLCVPMCSAFRETGVTRYGLRRNGNNMPSQYQLA